MSARYVNKQRKKGRKKQTNEQQEEKKITQDVVERLPIGQRKRNTNKIKQRKKLSTRLENLSRQELIFFLLQRLSDGMNCVDRVVSSRSLSPRGRCRYR